MHTNDTALPIWAMEILEDQPDKSFVRLRDLPDHYYNFMKKYMPRHKPVNGCLCITRTQFVTLINRYNNHMAKYVQKRKAIRQTSNA